MIVHALVSTESNRAIDLYLDRAVAEGMLRTILSDEPGFEDVLRVEGLELCAASQSNLGLS